MTCELLVDGRFRRGIVLDLSANGLFVQTASPPSPGAVVELRLLTGGERREIPLRARVARQRRVDPRLARIEPNGVGLEILESPPAFRELLEERSDPPRGASGASSSPRAAEGGPREGTPPREGTRPRAGFRVRVKQCRGARSRMLTVEATAEAEARSAALARMGEGWEVVEVSALSGAESRPG